MVPAQGMYRVQQDILLTTGIPGQICYLAPGKSGVHVQVISRNGNTITKYKVLYCIPHGKHKSTSTTEEIALVQPCDCGYLACRHVGGCLRPDVDKSTRRFELNHRPLDNFSSFEADLLMVTCGSVKKQKMHAARAATTADI